MGEKFEGVFCEPVQFYPSGWHVSRNKYTREQAALEISREIGKAVEPELLSESYVRYQFASDSVRSEMGCNHCWMICEVSHGAQPTWEYDNT